MTDFSGYSFSHYHIVQRLGEGGMASVYKAYDTHLERDVAVKVIRRDVFSPNMLEQVLKRFEREARSLARLSHPNIVKVIDYGEYEDVPYLVMEYLSGGTLKEKMGAPIPYGQAARLLLPIARALGYAHQVGLLHRDVKPANILFNESGEPYLADFGIARLLHSEGTTSLTSTGMTIGTPEYMAPEQGLGQAVDGRADQYALGVVFYEMITGRPPYSADTPLAVIFKHINDPLPHPKSFVPGLPDEVVKVLIKALSKKPENRYADMDAFAAALERLARLGQPDVEGQATQARPLPMPGGWKVTSRSGGVWLAVGGGVFVVGLCLVLIGSLYSGVPQKIFGRTTQTGLARATSIAEVMKETPIPDRTSDSPVQPDGGEGVARTQTAFAEVTQHAPGDVTPTNTPTLPETATLTPGEVPSSNNMPIITIPAGSFRMGSDSSTLTNEKPAHEVFLDNYSIDQTEVTNTMFSQFVLSRSYETDAEKEGWGYVYDYNGGNWVKADGANWQHPSGLTSSIDGLQNHPVVQVTWQDAAAYCQWAGKRLPTEAEWEKAARGADGRIYPWGHQEPDKSLLNYNNNLGNTTDVGSYPGGGSPYGVLDMAGNVWEWVSDRYDADYYQSSPASNPPGPTSGGLRVFRGGSWFESAGMALSAYRGKIDAAHRGFNLGFRCAK